MATAAEQISQIYVGYFNRAPDPAGLQYWITQLNNGMPLGEIADYFGNEQETLDLYPYLREPDLNSVDGFINQIYGNLFNRPADAAGLAFWKGQLESGAVSEGEFIAAIANGATGEGRLVLDNKVAVGVYFAAELSQNNVVWDATALDAAYQALAGVTLDPASVIDAKGEIDSFVDTGAWPGTVGETYTLTTGIDTIPGTAGNDTVQGVISNQASTNTLNTFDSINGAAGVNSLDLVIRANNTVQLQDFVDIENIQNVNILGVKGGVSAQTGTKVVNVAPNATANLASSVIDVSYFGDAVKELWQVNTSSSVIGLTDGQTVGFAGSALYAGVDQDQVRTAVFDGVEASVALDGVVDGAKLSVVGSKLTSLSISGSVEADANGDAGQLQLFSLGGKLTSIDLSVTSDLDVGLYGVATAQFASVKTLDASASTGGIELGLANFANAGINISLESLTLGSGDDQVSIGQGALKSDLVVDLGAGDDAILIATVGGTQTGALSVAGGEGSDTFAFGVLANYSADLGSLVTIEDFDGSLGVDVIDISGLSGVKYLELNNNQLNALAGSASLDAAITAAISITANDQSTAFNYGGDLYIVSETLAGGAASGVIQVAGTSIADLQEGVNFLV